MEEKNPETSGAGEVQIYELTMDNPEDQDELNRKLRKPGEPARDAAANLRGTEKGESGPGQE